MAKNRKKIIILNTLLLIFCCVIIAVYCLNPLKDEGVKKFTLSFDSDGGTAIAALDFDECKIIERPTDPEKEGYIFAGWMLGSQLFDFSEEVCGDVELKASWEEKQPDINYVTYYIDRGDGSERTPVVVAEDIIPNMPSDPVRDGFDFAGWKLNGEDYNFDKPLKDNDVVVASWVEQPAEDPNAVYDVTFNLNGGTGTTPSKQSVKSGEKATVPSEKPTRDKYDFVGWGTNRNGTTANIGSVQIRRNTVFYAIWKSNVKTYTVNISLGSGGKATSCTLRQTVEENSSPKGCTNPTRSNYEFVEWTDGTNRHSSLSQFVINKNTTITARWTQYNYSVRYELGNGSGCGDINKPGGASYSFKVCSPKAPTFKQLETFVDGDGRSRRAGSTITLYKNNPSIVLTARYTDITYEIVCKEKLNGQNQATGMCVPSLKSGSGLKIFADGDDVTNGVPLPSAQLDNMSWKVCLSSNTSTCTTKIKITHTK